MMSTDPVVVNKNDNQGSQFYNTSKGFNGPAMNGPNGDYQQQNTQYNPYGQNTMRGGFPPNPQTRGGMPGSMVHQNSNNMPPSHSNYGPNPQRMMGGSNVPTGGSTPTLNSLLQTPNSGQRYPQPGYGDYGQPKGGNQEMMAGNPNYSNPNWSGQQRPMNPYQQQQMQGNPAFRNQYPQGFNNSTGPVGYNQSSNFMPTSQGPGVMPSSQSNHHPPPPGQMSPSQSSSHATPPPGHHTQPSPGPPLKPSDDHSRPSSQHSDANAPPMTNGIDALSMRGDESNDSSIHSQKQDGSLFASNTEQDQQHQSVVNSNSIDSQHNNIKRSSSSSSCNTPTTSSSSSHNSVQNLRPPASPAGSTGSRSTTPHSITGNQAGSPMPPRPPAGQAEGPGRITSPMNQGYNNSQMMPPPMGPNQMGYGQAPNKMQHNPNMMHGSQMPGHYNQQYSTNQQGPYGRGGQGMPGYGGQPNYNGPSPNQMGGNQMYPNNMGGGMNRGGMPPSGYYGQPPNAQSGLGSSGSSYGYNNQTAPNMPPGQSMHPGMQGPPGHAQGPPGHAQGPPGHAQGPPGHAQGPPGHAQGPPGHAQGPPGHVPQVPHGGPMPPQNEQPSHGMPPQMQGGAPPGSLAPHTSQPHRGHSPHMVPPASQQPSQANQPASQPSLPQPSQAQQQAVPPGGGGGGNVPASLHGPKGAQAAAHAAMLAASQQHASQQHASQQHLTRPPINPTASQAPPPVSGAPGAPQQRPLFGQYAPPSQSGTVQGGGYTATPPQKPGMDGQPAQYGYQPSGGGQSQATMPNDMATSSSSHQPMAAGGMSYSSANVAGSTGGPNQPGGMGGPNQPGGMGGPIQPGGMGGPNQPGGMGYGMNGAVSQHSTNNINNSLPPNAVAPTAANYGQSANSNNNMGPPNLPPPSSVPGAIKTEPDSSHTGSQAVMQPPASDIKPDIKQEIAGPQLSGGVNVTTTTQSVTEPIMNSTVSSASPMGVDMTSSSSSLKPPTPLSVKQESIGTDESSQDSFKGPSTKPEQLTKQQRQASDVLQRQCELGDEPERRAFLEQLFAHMDERGSPVQNMPQISKNYIDLFKLFNVVKEKGGLLEATKNKKWREIGTAINIGTSSSAGFTLKKNYCKLILPFECKLNGVELASILAQIEAPQKKDKRGFDRGGAGYDGYGMNHEMQQAPMMPPNVSLPGHGMAAGYGQPGMMPNQGGIGYQGNQAMMGNQAMGYQGNQGMMANQGMGGYQGNPQGMMGNQGMGYQGMVGNQGMMQGNMMGGGSMGVQPGMAPGNIPNTSMANQMMPNSSMMQNRGPTPGAMNNDSNSNLSQPESFSGSETSSTPNKQFPPLPPNSSMSSQVPPYSANSQSPSFGGFNRNLQSSSGPMPPFVSNSKGSGQDSFGSTPYPGRIASPYADSSSQPGAVAVPNPSSMQRPQDQSQMYHQQRFAAQGSQAPSVANYPAASPQQAAGAYQQGVVQGAGAVPMQQRKPGGMYPQQRAPYPQNMRREAWGNLMQQGPRYPAASMGAAPYSAAPPVQPQPQQHPRMMAPRPEAKTGYQQSPSSSQQKMKGHLSTTAYAPKKDLMFMSDCVEATQPVLKKRKRLIYRDIGRIDPWRIMMALKSGQLLDSTWALDVLNVLLFDDHTVVYFGLQHMPGLLDVLLEHFRRQLCEIFGSDFDELEVQSNMKNPPSPDADETMDEWPEMADRDDDAESESSDSEDDEPHDRRVRDLKTVFTALKPNFPVDLPDSESLFAPGNYTMKTRCGKHVKIDKNMDNMHLPFDTKEWDVHDGFACSKKQTYSLGKGDMTLHIQTHMESESSQDVLRSRFYKRKNRGEAAAKANVKSERGGGADIIKTLDSSDSLVRENTHSLRENTPSLRENTPSSIPVSSETCDSQCRENSSSSSAKQAVVVKTEPNLDSSQSKEGSRGERTVAESDHSKTESDHSKTEQSSSCSTDSGIHVKSEASENCADIKMELDTACEVKAELSENEPKCGGGKNVVVKLEAIKTETADMKHCIISSNNENDKQFLSHLKRKWEEGEVDNEEYRKDETPLCLLKDSQEEIARRCVCISNIFRSLSFIPGNDREMSHHRGIMTVLGKLILFRHRHNARSHDHRTFDKEVDTDIDEDTMESQNEEWWWSTLDAVRENVLVILANISGQMNLSVFPEQICMPVLDGLLHWAICPSAYAQDPMPTMPPNSVLSPKKLVIETLAKLCVTDINVDLILATPPFSRIVNLFSNLIKSIADHSDQVLRELSLAILSYLVQGDSSAARAIALQHPAINLLLDVIEAAEIRTAQFVKAHGAVPKGDNCELLGTSVDMLRKAAKTLSCLATVPENQTLFLAKQDRILSLAMSNIIDSKVVEYLSDVLFSVSQEPL